MSFTRKFQQIYVLRKVCQFVLSQSTRIITMLYTHYICSIRRVHVKLIPYSINKNETKKFVHYSLVVFFDNFNFKIHSQRLFTKSFLSATGIVFYCFHNQHGRLSLEKKN